MATIFKPIGNLIMPTLTKLKAALLRRKSDPKAVMFSFLDARKKIEENKVDGTREDGVFSYTLPNHLNFFSLKKIKDYNALASFDFITVTDGPFLLIDFFIRFSRPGNALSTCLLIPKDFRKWVPSLWAYNTLYYEVVPTRYFTNNKNDKINNKFFLTLDDTGLISESSVTQDFLALKNSSKSDIPIFTHLHQCQQAIVPSKKERPFFHLRKLLQLMTEADQFINFTSFTQVNNPENCLFHFSKEIKNWIFMSEFEHKLLSLGMKRLTPLKKSPETPDSTIPISAHHQLNIFDLPPEDNTFLWTNIQKDVNRLGVIDNVIGSDLAVVINEMISRPRPEEEILSRHSDSSRD